MPATEVLPFTVNLWAADELSIEQVLAAGATLSIARAAFDVATMSFPGRMVSLIGPGTLETRSAVCPADLEEPRPGRRGWTRPSTPKPDLVQ